MGLRSLSSSLGESSSCVKPGEGHDLRLYSRIFSMLENSSEASSGGWGGEDAIGRPGVLSVFCEMGLGKEGLDGENETD